MTQQFVVRPFNRGRGPGGGVFRFSSSHQPGRSLTGVDGAILGLPRHGSPWKDAGDVYVQTTLPYLARQSVAAKPPFGRSLPRNPCKIRHGSEAWTRVYPRPKALRRSSQWCLEKGWATDKKWSNGQRESPEKKVSLPFCRPFPLTAVVRSGVMGVVE